ncbi:MAG: tetratricopeptide repeat protein [Planctomycetota bacterium]
MAPFGPAAPIQTAEAAEANPAFLNDLAQVYLRYGVLDKAEPLLRSAMEKSKDPAQKQQALSSLAQVLQRKGDAKGAAELYEQALQGAANPAEKTRVQMSLAESYAGANEFEKAEKILNEIAARSDQNPMAVYQRQEAQRQLAQIWQKEPGRLDKVIEETEKALAANPKDAAALERLAEIYSRAKPDGAKAALPASCPRRQASTPRPPWRRAQFGHVANGSGHPRYTLCTALPCAGLPFLTAGLALLTAGALPALNMRRFSPCFSLAKARNTVRSSAAQTILLTVCSRIRRLLRAQALSRTLAAFRRAIPHQDTAAPFRQAQL